MKTVSNGYKNQIKEMGREIDVIISYYNHYKVITEDNYYILTEDGQKVLTEQINNDDVTLIGSEDNYGCKLIIHGTLLKTMMKEFDFEVKQDMKIGSIVDFKFGVKVNNEYEYIDYGKFIVHEKEYNEDTKTYSYVAYDYMLFTMTPFVRPDLSEWSGEFTLFDLANYICEKCGLELGIEAFPNSEREIYSSQLISLEEAEMTFRDVLDYLTEVTGCTSFVDNNAFIITTPNNSHEILTADYFKDTNVKFNKVYGPINSILFSRSEDSDIVEMKDDESIEQNGITQIVIKDNPFLEGTDRSDYFEEMFDTLKDLTFTTNEYSSTGVTFLDFLDMYDVIIDNKTYNCLLLNDEININQGLEENIFTEEPEETTKEYRTSRLSDKDQKWANIQVKKDVGEITLEVGQINNNINTLSTEVDGKVGNNEIISKINLSPEQITINSNKLSLTGKTIALTSDNINIASTNFSVDTSGNMTCNNATMNNATANNVNVVGGQIYITRDGTQGNVPIVLEQTYQGETYKVNIGAGSVRFYKGSSTLAYLSAGIMNYGRLLLYNSSGSETIKLLGNTGEIVTTGIITSSNGICQGSRQEIKKNFEKFKNALDIVKDTDIYTYNLKKEKDTDKKHIGFVIGDDFNYRKEVTDSNNQNADLYSMISVLWQAVKEQQEEIEKLKERIDNK